MSTNSHRLSPRQRMINLMYIVLTAMLALNVSSDVLDGFTEVEKGISKSNKVAHEQNRQLLMKLRATAVVNPDKASKAYTQAETVTSMADSLCSIIDSLKLNIVIEADGKNGNPEEIESREDLEAASVVMLNPMTNNATKLKMGIDNYRNLLLDILKTDNVKSETVERILSTAAVKKEFGTSWETEKFDNKPVVAAITLLSQLQSDIRAAEGETLREILNSVDAGDVRVNEMNAFVIPKSQMVMKGGVFEADIVLAAVDSTDRPVITVNGRELPYGQFNFTETASTLGQKNYSGSIKAHNPDGTVTEYPFDGSYTVIEPMATVSATMMNMLYAGIDNPISISVAGIPSPDISATISGGTLTRNGNNWIARPVAPGKDIEIVVSAKIDGKMSRIASHVFKVRRLPDPTPYISYSDAQGNEQLYRGGKPFAKSMLTASAGLNAAIDDGVLNIPFKIIGFETVFFDSMGNAMVEVSDGANFSQRQKDNFRRLGRGKRFYISKIRAIGPDGVTRDLSPLEVIVN